MNSGRDAWAVLECPSTACGLSPREIVRGFQARAASLLAPSSHLGGDLRGPFGDLGFDAATGNRPTGEPAATLTGGRDAEPAVALPRHGSPTFTNRNCQCVRLWALGLHFVSGTARTRAASTCFSHLFSPPFVGLFHVSAAFGCGRKSQASSTGSHPRRAPPRCPRGRAEAIQA